jgi:hypothetical protein
MKENTVKQYSGTYSATFQTKPDKVKAPDFHPGLLLYLHTAYIFAKVRTMEVTRLSWLTNRALVYEPKCGGKGGGGVAASQPVVSANEYCCTQDP